MADPLFVILVLVTFVAVVILTLHHLSVIKNEAEQLEFESRRREKQKRLLEQEKVQKIRDKEQHADQARQLKAEAKRVSEEKRREEQILKLTNLGAAFGIVEVNLDLSKLPVLTDQMVIRDNDGFEQSVDLGQLTCSCERFQSDKFDCSQTHASRLCEHLFEAIDEKNGFSWATDLERALIKIGTREVSKKAYSFWHPYDGWFFVIVGKDTKWISVFHRDKGDMAEWSSYQRSGWNLFEKRWSFGEKVATSGDFTKILREIRELEDFDRLVESKNTKPNASDRSLSVRSNPLTNPDFTSDKFGPVDDAYDRPIGDVKNSVEFEGRILFSYVDSKQQKSRRTVVCREMQNYGNQGYFLYAFCELRKAGRTFDVLKMSNISDVETGEVIEDIADYVEFQANNSGRAQLKKWAEDSEPLAKAWLYLFQANKKPSQSEYKVLKSVLSTQLENVQLSSSDIKRYHDELAIPTAVGFQRLVASIIKRHPEKLKLFADTAREIVNVRKSPNFADLAALEFMEQRIKKGK